MASFADKNSCGKWAAGFARITPEVIAWTQQVMTQPLYLLDDCGHQQPQNTSQILKQKYPWTVWVIDEWTGAFCMGSIISQYHVLTAGHCIYDAIQSNEEDEIIVVYGYDDLDKMKDEVTDENWEDAISTIDEIILYPDFNAMDYWKHTSDVAILVLNKTLTFSPTVAPICLQLNPTTQYDSRKATLARLNMNGMLSSSQKSNTIFEDEVTVMSNTNCTKTFTWLKE